MKLLVCSLHFLFAVSTFGQGILLFYNRGLMGNRSLYNAPVSLPNGSLAAGDAFTAGLFLVEDDSSLTLVGTTPFRSGAASGFFFQTHLTVPRPPGQSPLFRARVWETAAGSYEAAASSGMLHGEFPTLLGDGTIRVGPLKSPIDQFPLPVTNGLLPFTLVPEPAVTALLTFMGAALLALRRKRKCAPED